MEDYQNLKNAGFSDAEIRDYMKPELVKAGFDEQEINQYFVDFSGERPLSLSGAEQNETIKKTAKAIDNAAAQGRNLGFKDAIQIGYQNSVIGMINRGKLPDEVNPEEMATLNFAERAAMGISGVVSDIPLYWAGSQVGAPAGAAAGGAVGSIVPGVGTATGAAVGGVIGAGAGAFALEEGARQTLVDMYTRGEVTSFDELLHRVKNASKAAGKGAALGAATSGVGMATKVGMQAVGAGAKATAAVGYAGEVGTLTAGGAALNGEIPTAQDFIDNAVLIAGLKGVNYLTAKTFNKIRNDVSRNLKKAFVKDGTHPAEMCRMAKEDPVVLQELLAKPELKAAKDNLVKTLENGNFSDVNFGKLSPEKKEALNKIRTEDGPMPLMIDDNLVIPKNVVEKLYNRRILHDKMTADNLADLLLEVFHSPHSIVERSVMAKENPEMYKHIQALINLKKDLSEIGFISVNPANNQTVIKTGFKVKTKRIIADYDKIGVSLENSDSRVMNPSSLPDEMFRVSAARFSTPQNNPKVKGLPDGRAYSSLYTPDKSGIAVHEFPLFGKPFNKGSINKTENNVNKSMSATADGQSAFIPAENFTAVNSSEAVKLSGAVKKLQEQVNIPFRTGKFGNKSRNVLGFYRINPEVIRLRVANDIETLSHEVGHHLEKVIFGDIGSKTTTAYFDELSKIATKPSKNTKEMYSAEGFAEFISKYITQPTDAKKAAPKFYDFFETEMKNKAPEILNTLLETRATVEAWVKQPAVMRVLSSISFNKNEVKPFTLAAKDLWNKFYTAIVDDLHPIKLIREELVKNNSLPVSIDPYIQARLLRGGWVGRATHFLEKATFDFNDYKNNGKALKEIIGGIENLDEFTAYLTARRALELENRGIRSGIDVKAGIETIKQLNNKYQEKAAEIYAYQDRVLQYYRDAGMLSMDDYLKIKTENKNYVPFQRVMDADSQAQTVAGGKTMKARQGVKKIKGSGRDIINPLESIIADTYKMINLAERNYIGLTLANLTNFKGSGKFIEKVPNSLEKVKLPENMQMVKADKLGNWNFAGDEFYRQSNYFDKNNQIQVYRNGKSEIYQVNPELAKVVNGLAPQEVGLLQKVLSMPAKTLRGGATLTWEFIGKNMFRDSLQAFITSENGFIPGKDSYKGLMNAIKKTDTFWEWQKSGGAGSSMVSMDRTTLERTLNDLNTTGYTNKVWNRLNVLEDSRILSELAEQSTRLGEFAKALEGKPLTKENLQKAGLDSREVTLDFARAGAVGRAVNSYVAFFNAGIQGTDKFFKTLHSKPKEAAKLAAFSLVMPSVMLAIAGYGDKDIEEVPQVQRDLNWVFKINGVIYRLPKPQQWGLIGTMAEKATIRFLDSLNGKEKDDFYGSLAKTAFDEFQLNLIPTGVTPLIEDYANRNIFLDRPIIPADRERALPEYQYTPYTNELTKAVSRTLGRVIGRENTFSPAVAENYVRGWTGGMGSYLLELSDFALRKAGVLEDKNRVYRLEDSPFIRAFTVRHPSGNAESIHKFREEFHRLQKYAHSFDVMRRERNFEEVENLAEFKVFDSLKGINQTLSENQKLIRNIEGNPDIPVDEQRQTIDELYQAMIDTAKLGLMQAKELKKTIDF